METTVNKVSQKEFDAMVESRKIIAEAEAARNREAIGPKGFPSFRVSTGGGFGARTLYSDDGETIFNSMRPSILNGISDVASRHDLIDRAVMITLEMIPEEQRKPEKEIWKKFDRMKPRILGGLFEAVSSALRNQGRVSFDRLPRMADFALWAAAAEKGRQWSEEITFMEAYSGNRATAVEMAVDADLVSDSIMKLMLLEKGTWKGSSVQLFEKLSELIPERSRNSKAWPKQANVMTGRLKRGATFLRTLGVDVVFPDRKAKAREYIITQKGSDGSGQTGTEARPEPETGTKQTEVNHVLKEQGSGGSGRSGQKHTLSKKGFSQKKDDGGESEPVKKATAMF